MKFCDERIQRHLLNGGKIIRSGLCYPLFLSDYDRLSYENEKDKVMEYALSKIDLTLNDWEIVEPEYDWDKISEDKILCLFSDNKNFRYNIFSTLRMKDNYFYHTDSGTTYRYCKPFNPEDYKIAKNIKDYEK